MRIISRLILVAIVMATCTLTFAEDVTLNVCRLSDDIFQFSFTGRADGWWFNNSISYDLDTLIAIGDGTEFVLYYDGMTESIFAAPDTPFCSDDNDDWQPDAPSIPIPLTSDCAWVEIDNHDGGWSRVEVDGEPVLLHYGDALIGGQNQSTDPADYRAVETACPG